MTLGFASCADKYDLGDVDINPDELVEGVAFTVTPDASNPNLIHLKSLLGPEYQPYWSHSQGQSQKPDA